MAILVKEKDVLFFVMNLITFLYSVCYLMLDQLAMIAQLLADEAGLAALLTAASIFRAEAYVIFVIVLVITVSMDCWWGLRILRDGMRIYRKENL